MVWCEAALLMYEVVGVYQRKTGKHLNVRVHLTKPYDYILTAEI